MNNNIYTNIYMNNTEPRKSIIHLITNQHLVYFNFLYFP